MTVQSYFQSRADWFNALYEEDHPVRYRVNRLVRPAIFDRVAMTLDEFRGWKGYSVLDVGCGPGRNSVAFVKAGAARVVGIDFSDRMVEIARGFSREHGTESKCEFVQDDFMACIPFQTFDAVVALGFFDYVENAEDALKRMTAAARYKVIGSFPARSSIRAPLRRLRYAMRGCPVYFYTRQQIEDICVRVGLKHFRIIPLGPGFFLVGSCVDDPPPKFTAGEAETTPSIF